MMFIMMMFEWRMVGGGNPRTYKEDVVGRMYDMGFNFTQGTLEIIDSL